MDRIRQLRKERGLSQARLAVLADMDPATLNRLERGTGNPNLKTLQRVAGALDVAIADLLENESPKDLSPRLPLEERGERTPEEFEQVLAHVLEPAHTEALREQQSANRFLSSEGRPQDLIGDPPEAEVGRRFLEDLSPAERPLAFAEVALGRARFERRNATLEETLTRAERLLRERDEKIARLEGENAHLREEHEQAKAEKP